ncbi:MAG: hypothetical protein IPP71_09840 [Bacteroidetes bacterium]|nr:hypothetical protein [Bacteroidota bacterium]
MENNKYNFLSAVAYYLLSKKKGKTFKKVVREYYFSPQTPNKSQVAEMVGCSKERVRQVIFETESKL